MIIKGNRFHFVRHAETEWNSLKLCQGLRDIPLNSKGKEQSLRFGQNSVQLPIGCIISSPLKRAHETAQIIQTFHPHAAIHLLDEFKERDWGALEGISSQYMYQIEEQEEFDLAFNPGQGIESRVQMKERLIVGLNKAFNLHSTPLIVSHGRLFVSLCELLNVPFVRQIPNLAIVEFHKLNSQWKKNILHLGDS